MPVYLIHFAQPYYHARHYLGCTLDLESRVRSHRRGTGAKLLRAVNAAGIGWDVVRVWEDGGYDLEHMLKSLHNAPRLCPICQQQAVTEAMDEQVWVEEEEFWVGG